MRHGDPGRTPVRDGQSRDCSTAFAAGKAAIRIAPGSIASALRR